MNEAKKLRRKLLKIDSLIQMLVEQIADAQALTESESELESTLYALELALDNHGATIQTVINNIA